MITSRRDYILRIIDEVTRLLARVVFKRRAGATDEALQAIVQSCERLFAMDSNRLFQFTPEQHYVILTRDEEPLTARDKVLLYAAINVEAGQLYTKIGKTTLARASFLNALRFTLRARTEYSADALPEYTPSVPLLRESLGTEPLDPDTQELLAKAGI